MINIQLKTTKQEYSKWHHLNLTLGLFRSQPLSLTSNAILIVIVFFGEKHIYLRIEVTYFEVFCFDVVTNTELLSQSQYTFLFSSGMNKTYFPTFCMFSFQWGAKNYWCQSCPRSKAIEEGRSYLCRNLALFKTFCLLKYRDEREWKSSP